jgi:hypothetical protein
MAVLALWIIGGLLVYLFVSWLLGAFILRMEYYCGDVPDESFTRGIAFLTPLAIFGAVGFAIRGLYKTVSQAHHPGLPRWAVAVDRYVSQPRAMRKQRRDALG